MGFIDAIKSGFANYVNFSGRASRSEYWWFHLFYLLCLILSFIPAGFSPEPGFVISFVLLALILIYLGLLIPSISVGVRRLHDQDMSGLWYLLIFVPAGGLVLFVLFIIKGTEGDNRFGPDPLIQASNTPRSNTPIEDDTPYSRSNIPKVPRD